VSGAGQNFWPSHSRRLKPFLRLSQFLVLCVVAVGRLSEAQELVRPEQIAHVNGLFEARGSRGSLKCQIRPWGPVLDFNLQYETGFVLAPDLAHLAAGQKLAVFLRVTPEQRPPVLLFLAFEVPASAAANQSGSESRIPFTVTGDFSVGEGRYEVEVLLVDAKDRTFYDHWKLDTGKYNGGAVPSPLKPLTVAPSPAESWDGRLDPHGLRVTMLLDATDTSPNAAQLRPWNAAYMLKVLATVLGQVPCRSVKLVAFNLDERKEVFRRENFSSSDFVELARTLKNLQLASIPYQALRRSGWQKFLVGFASDENNAAERPDAVVFIGASTHFLEKPFQQKISTERALPFFYFEYYGFLPSLYLEYREYSPRPSTNPYGNLPTTSTYAVRSPGHFPDAIDFLTQGLHGTVFHIYAPKDLGPAIQKMRSQLGASTRDSPSPEN
jgi:hypothetical protein